MLKKVLLLAMIIYFSFTPWENNTLYKTKKFRISKDTIYLEKKVSVFFKIVTNKGAAIADTLYQINFEKDLFTHPNLTATTDSLVVNYLKFPDFLTKVY
jgi:hypothetical protein